MRRLVLLDDFDTLNARLERASPAEILAWAWERFGDQLAASSSFQTQSIPLLHMIATTCPKLPVYFLDTGFHFPETLAFRRELEQRFRLNVVDARCEGGHDRFLERHGLLYSRDPDLCCFINKVEPMQRILAGHAAWLTGIRRDQTDQRAATRIVAVDEDGRYKIAPMAAWTAADINAYLELHDLPAHPLAAAGFRSIGCQPCTRAVQAGEPDRDGRWHGTAKTECGLHADYFRNKLGVTPGNGDSES